MNSQELVEAEELKQKWGHYWYRRLSTPKPSSLDWVWPWTYKYCCKATNKSYISHFFSFVKRHVLSLVFRPFFYNKTRPGIFFERESTSLHGKRQKRIYRTHGNKKEVMCQKLMGHLCLLASAAESAVLYILSRQKIRKKAGRITKLR